MSRLWWAAATTGMVALGLLATPSAGAEPTPAPVEPTPAPAEPLPNSTLAVITGILDAAQAPSGGPLEALATAGLPGQAPTAPSVNPMNNAYLLPQNVAPAAPGTGEIVGVAPGQELADLSTLDYLNQLRTLYQNGSLEGALLGQNPGNQPGEPLPPG